MSTKVAALYVQEDGCYPDVPGVEVWGVSRDARAYPGPWPVVAHPPCARWGRYARGGPRYHGRFAVGADDGCFAAALASVRRWGGVLEHPEGSHAWRWHDLTPPTRGGGWTAADLSGGLWTRSVAQGAYGHQARKQTWLLVSGCALPDLAEMPQRHHPPAVSRLWRTPKNMSSADRDARRAALAAIGAASPECMSRRQREATPEGFRDLLISIARTKRPELSPSAESPERRP